VGGWAAIVLNEGKKTILKGIEHNTTHNRMEITAVLNAIDFAVATYPRISIEVFTDSQYVVGLRERMDRLQSSNFITKAGNVLNNTDLIQELFLRMKNHDITFQKVKAHLKNTGEENLNREVDMICRKIMRENG
jgi:ribonuclease HI